MVQKGERELVEYWNKKEDRVVGLCTTNEREDAFYFYEFDGRDYKKIGRCRSPVEIEIKFNLRERMGMK